MSNIYPLQQRTIDSYESYNSNVVNRITRMVTLGENVMLAPNFIDVLWDSTSISELTVTPGKCVKDDVIIELTDYFSVDMTVSDFYITPEEPYWNEVGYYYIVLEYIYLKSRPAPRASIRIIKPSQHGLFTEARYLFLKAVRVVFEGGIFKIVSVHDWNPNDISVMRKYPLNYAGIFDVLPEWDDKYIGVVVYITSTENFYWGTASGWQDFSHIKAAADTSECAVGELAYLVSDGNMKVLPAIATSHSTMASCCVLSVGSVGGLGLVRLYGYVENVLAESGTEIKCGHVLYLSDQEAGRVTNLLPLSHVQSVGWALTDIDEEGKLNIWFAPGSIGSCCDDGAHSDIYQDLLSGSIFTHITSDSFRNYVFYDELRSTTSHDVFDGKLNGSNGDVFYSDNLIADDFDGTCVTHCQISANCENEENLVWSVSNNGSTDDDWESLNLNEIHIFSSHNIEITGKTDDFIIGERIVGDVSGNAGYVNMDYTTYLLIRDVEGTGSFSPGETIIGQESGASATFSSQTLRDDFVDLRVRCDFLDTASIYDYGILYEIDGSLQEFIDNRLINIETLYADLYSIPSIDNDGLANLPVPIQTCKSNLQLFVGSPNDSAIQPNYDSLRHITQSQSLKQSIEKIDSILPISNVSRTTTGESTPSVISVDGKQLGILLTNNSGSTTITNFLGGVDFQILIIIFGDGNTTVQSGANIKLNGLSNMIGATNDTLTLIYTGSLWVELSRSVNNS
ncbi:MAG: hypothetical protein BWY04_01075 [candidate division CPR1 bacterium ADurb.Bin160]|uniref:Depolymerase 2 capsule K5-specific C-terminal domain-containing protein n=1 Tax=candidate division CPR1 bacterium ADurb.Bin160 TaxID=1852826 RepID=A0A1V5ZLI0_9BACT|nr:MAG: hypothetical protein BWY04_01075 [candidate division CPR1 bacterium ADurb.Bin160]